MFALTRNHTTDAIASYVVKKAVIDAFWHLHSQGRNAAIDIDHVTGTMVLMAKTSGSGQAGFGSIPEPYNDNYLRILVTSDSKVSK